MKKGSGSRLGFLLLKKNGRRCIGKSWDLGWEGEKTERTERALGAVLIRLYLVFKKSMWEWEVQSRNRVGRETTQWIPPERPVDHPGLRKSQRPRRMFQEKDPI